MTLQQTEDFVAQYLQSHPDFFKDHLEVLDKLYLPSSQEGTLSLVEVQLERQRQRIKSLEAELERFSQLARQEQDIFFGLMPLQHSLSHCINLQQGEQHLNLWAQKLDLQQAKILLFNDQWRKHPTIDEHYWVDRKAFELIRLERMGLRQFYLGQLTHKEKTLLFLPEEFPIGSVACCLLGAKTAQKPTALLLFSARDEHHFHNGQDTAFLKHLVSIVELHLQRWMANYMDNA